MELLFPCVGSPSKNVIFTGYLTTYMDTYLKIITLYMYKSE